MFADAGKFWTASAVLPDMPTGLRSVGAGVRVNAAGVMVFEIDAVRPRPMPIIGRCPHGFQIQKENQGNAYPH